METDNKLKRAGALGIEALAGTDVLNGRVEGRKVFEKIIKHMECLPLDTILPLDFSGIKFLDYSCADEIICRIIARIRSGELGVRFLIQNVSSIIEENIAVALDARDLCCLFEQKGEMRIVGKISDPLKVTYEFALKKGTVTAGEVERAFKIKVSASSNRLATLESMGLIYKIEEGSTGRGGKRYLYRVVS